MLVVAGAVRVVGMLSVACLEREASWFNRRRT
jgi:hypothetical protein